MTGFIDGPNDFRLTFLQVAGGQQDDHLNIAPGASGLADCPRASYYRLTKTERTPGRSLEELGEGWIAARMGNAIEPEVNSIIKQMGFKLTHVQTSWALMGGCGEYIIGQDDERLLALIEEHRQDGVHLCTVEMTGHPDGVLTAEDPTLFSIPTPVLLEVKYMNYRRFMELGKALSLEEYDRDYYLQVQANMAAFGLDNAVFLAFAKDSVAVKWAKRSMRYDNHPFMQVQFIPRREEPVEEGRRLADAVLDKVQDGELPERKYSPFGGQKADWKCRYCPWWLRCPQDGEEDRGVGA